jgi:hypothetical protein
MTATFELTVWFYLPMPPALVRSRGRTTPGRQRAPGLPTFPLVIRGGGGGDLNPWLPPCEGEPGWSDDLRY